MMTDLFVPEPEQWGFRGDPHVWVAVRDRLTGVPVPGTVAEAGSLLRETFHEVVGIYPEEQGDKVDGKAVYREEFDTGGMSAGGVALVVWRDRLLPLLTSRAGKATAGRSWAGEPDDAALLRDTPAPAVIASEDSR